MDNLQLSTITEDRKETTGKPAKACERSKTSRQCRQGLRTKVILSPATIKGTMNRLPLPVQSLQMETPHPLHPRLPGLQGLRTLPADDISVRTEGYARARSP